LDSALTMTSHLASMERLLFGGRDPAFDSDLPITAHVLVISVLEFAKAAPPGLPLTRPGPAAPGTQLFAITVKSPTA
jgi:hypothetical protein